MAKLPFTSFLFFVLVQASATLPPPSSATSHLREQRRFHRADPLRGFRVYEGGYDPQNKHYWASAVFTGLHGFVMAGSWAIAGAGLLGFLKLWKKKNNLERSPGSASSRCRLLPVLAIAVFSLLAVVFYGTAMAAVLNFHGKAQKLERALLGAGRATCDAIRRVMAALGKIRKHVCPGDGDGDGDGDERLCHLTRLASKMLKAKLTDLKRTIRKEGHLFDIALVVLFGATLGIISLSMLLVIVGVVALLLQWRTGLTMVIVFCWILTSLCWALVGIHSFLHIFIDDTCSAFEEFQLNPRNSSLGKMLPCPNSTSTNKMAEDAGIVIHNLINLELGKYKKMVAHKSFEMVKSYGISSQSFVNVIPGARKLLHCTIVKEAFEKIVAYQCRPLKSLVKLLWLVMILFSVSLMLLEIAWICAVPQGRRTS